MLDDKNYVSQRDSLDSLGETGKLPVQMTFNPDISGDIKEGQIEKVVMAGMGGSALAADMVKVMALGEAQVPFEVVKGYDLPNYCDEKTLVIAISHSGNTEETLECYSQARQKGCALAAMATGGKLGEVATVDGVPFAKIPVGAQPRMLTIYHLRSLLKLLELHGLISGKIFDQIAQGADWLGSELAKWAIDVPQVENYAKQLATQSAGKTAVFYGGQLTAPLSYKWKISWNESSKNLAFSNQYPEFSHNEFMGWTSHPVEKPYMVFDIRSNLERPRIRERMELTDRMLSGMRPKATVIELRGENLVEQMLWGLALADMTSIYLGILNNVDPAPVELIEKFKKELS